MGDVIINFFVFSSFLIALFISLGELVQKEKSFVDYIFLSSFLGLACWYLQLSLLATGVFNDRVVNFYAIALLSPVAFAVPPLMSNRYRWIITDRHSIRKKYIFVFIPSLISLSIVSAPVFYDALRFNDNFYLKASLFSREFMSLPLYSRIVYALVPLESIYLIVMMIPVLTGLFTMIKESRETRHADVSKMGYLFASLITLSNIFALAGLLFSIPFLKFAILFSTAAMTGLYLVTQRHPDYNRLLKSITRKHNYEKSQIRGLNIPAVTERLFELMDDEKIFADEELTLPALADELNITPHQLSEILNREIKKNFNSFVNEYRVKEAKELLIEQPDRSILSVGVAAGFNSATTFNSVFGKVAGMTPGKYRKIMLEKQE
ncbi:MAG TPA: helix-turn-helix domain-containing protein [Spirochaetota bacterium]|nr:helix-turn-helix domain-containing protein [Spirochaetota bacterium]HPJ42705.1 helix-turn-helix domain-containing protein [Spirochaetota bacterium]HRX49165.1 helix-turn-helix domain-containing protein [Spirochaetota bacterium]